MALLTLVYAIFGVFTVAMQNNFIFIIAYIVVLNLFLASTWRRSRILIAPPIKPARSTYIFFHPIYESPNESLAFMHELLTAAQKARLDGNLEKTWNLLKHFQSIWNEVLIQKIQEAFHR